MNEKDLLKQTILERENEIKNALDKIKSKKLSEKIKEFDIEIFVYPYTSIDAVLFSMDNNLNEVFDDNTDVFSGSLTLINKLNIEHLNIKYMDEITNTEIYDIIFDTLKEIIARYSKDIKIPIFLMFHDTSKKLNIITNS